jgi:hypothetical protein
MGVAETLRISMNERIQEIAKEVGFETDVSGRWLPANSFEKFVDALLNECIEVVAHSPTHCAFTTYQLNVVECAIRQCTDELRKFKDGEETTIQRDRKGLRVELHEGYGGRRAEA